MKKRKFLCMIFVFSSLRSCSRIILPYFSLGKLCKEHGYTCEWPSGREPRLTENGNQTICKTENFVPIGSSQDDHQFLPQLLPRHRLRSIYQFHWNQQIREATMNLRETAAKELRETATDKVFPNGWRTSQRTARSQKYLHSQIFLMTRPTKKKESRKHSMKTHFPKDPNCEVCKRTKITRAPCRWRTGNPSSTSSREVW